MAHNMFKNHVNAAGLRKMRETVSRFTRESDGVTRYISVRLLIASKAESGDMTYSERQRDSRIVTNKGLIHIAGLPDNAFIGFTMTIASNETTSYTHKALVDANGESFIAETDMTLWTDGTTVNGIMQHIGYDMPDALAISLCRNHAAKLGKTQQWRVKKGVYSLTESRQESATLPVQAKPAESPESAQKSATNGNGRNGRKGNKSAQTKESETTPTL